MIVLGPDISISHQSPIVRVPISRELKLRFVDLFCPVVQRLKKPNGRKTGDAGMRIQTHHAEDSKTRNNMW